MNLNSDCLSLLTQHFLIMKNAVVKTLLVFNCKELLKKYYIKKNFLKQADHIYLANLADRFITNEHWNYKLPKIPVLQSITFSAYISVQTNL